jgi:Molybdopterin-guanine dinucleotide biosynthesis protein A
MPEGRDAGAHAGIREAAVLLGGGRASRLGGVDKPAVVVGVRSLADRAFDAVHGCSPIIAVGPASLAREGARLVREDPPFGGPVAGLRAGLGALGDDGSEWMLLLACDLPRAASAVALLRAAGDDAGGALDECDGFVLVDAGGRDQWLAGRYRVRSLRSALAAIGDPSGISMRRLVERLRLVRVPDVGGASIDLDTWDDIHAYRDAGSEENGERRGMTMAEQTTSPEDLDRWVEALGAELGVDVSAVPVTLLLDTTRDVAHRVTRPAGPLSTFIVGLAAARDGGTPESIERAVTATRELAARWNG